MSPRRSLLAVLISAALVVSASPAMAITPQASTSQTVIPGWSPSDPPFDRMGFEAQLAEKLYSVSCRGVAATGWASSMVDDTSYDWRSMLFTTSVVSTACADRSTDLVVRQGSETLPAYSWVPGSSAGLGSVAVIPYRPGAYWDFVPTPRVGQWVAIGGRSPDGSLLPILERRVVAVGGSTLSLNESVGSDYLGAPVVDNKVRVLGTVTSAGTEVTGSPVYCDALVDCNDVSKVWWDITAPSRVRDIRVIAGKGKVTVTWKPAASTGGAPVTYSYLVGAGTWRTTEAFQVTVRARKGTVVTIALGTVNDAGAGPTVIVTGRAK